MEAKRIRAALEPCPVANALDMAGYQQAAGVVVHGWLFRRHGIKVQGMSDSRRDISLVVARARNGAIGRAGDLPWHLPADLRHFKRLTVGKPVIMGRKTFESIVRRLGGPLPGRHNIVVTRQTSLAVAGASIARSLADAIAAAGLDAKIRPDEVMIIGGAEIYAQAVLFATRIYMTIIEVDVPDADAWFHLPDESQWREVSRETHTAQDGYPAHAFICLERR